MFVSRGFIYRILTVAKGCTETQSRFQLLSDGKRSIFSLSTSKVHDSILRKFVFLLFFGRKGHNYKSESPGFGKLKSVFIMCIFVWKQMSALMTGVFSATEIVLKVNLSTIGNCWIHGIEIFYSENQPVVISSGTIYSASFELK